MWSRWRVRTWTHSKQETEVSSSLVSIPESIIAFAWEPNGSKFAVLHGESPRISASFYHVKNNGKIELISKKKYTWSLLKCLREAPNAGFGFPQRCLTSSRPTASSGALRDSFWCWLDLGGELVPKFVPVTSHLWLVFFFFFFLSLNWRFSLQHEWSSRLCWHVRLHHDEHCWALHGLWRGVGPNWPLCRHLCFLVEPQGRKTARESTFLSPVFFFFFKICINVSIFSIRARWTTRTGCGRSRAACFRRTIRIVSVSYCGGPDPPPCSVQIRSR